MRLLEEFWYGNIEPTEYDTSSKEYSRLTFDVLAAIVYSPIMINARLPVNQLVVWRFC